MGPWVARALRRRGFRDVEPQAAVHVLRCAGALDFGRHAANLAALRVPTLVAWAEDDPLVESAVGELLYWRAPAGPRVRFPSGGHNIQKTRAIELGEALVAWCGELARGFEVVER